MPRGLIQNLLCDEYCQFRDTVLLESPFAETTREGRGLQQVYLGITDSKFIIASHNLNLLDEQYYSYTGSDCLEISSLFPVQYVKLSVYKKSSRQSLKACFINDATRYFELGCVEKRQMFWNLWCDRICQLNNNFGWAFKDETDDALMRRLECQDVNGFWPSPRNLNYTTLRARWLDKDVYLGKIRELENSQRPIAKHGTGDTLTEKLFYLNPNLYSVSNEKIDEKLSSEIDAKCDYDMLYTYTGGPTSNITYTSMPKQFSGYKQLI